jgi:hypothetical protein
MNTANTSKALNAKKITSPSTAMWTMDSLYYAGKCQDVAVSKRNAFIHARHAGGWGMSLVDGHAEGTRPGEFMGMMKADPKMYNLTLALQYLTSDLGVVETPF